MRKYELTDETIVHLGHTLHRIRALIPIGSVQAGDFGGWIETEDNLDQNGDAWVSENAHVRGNAHVCGNTWVSGNAHVCENAWVSGNARVFGNAQVSGNAHVCGNAWVCGNAHVSGDDTWMAFGPAGSRDDFTTFFACADGSIGVKCGCFYGNLDDFAKKVQATHGDNDHAKVYRAAIEIAKMRIRVGEKEAAEA